MRKNSGHRALEARRRKNRRKQNIIREAQHPTIMAVPVAVVEREEESAPLKRGWTWKKLLQSAGGSRASWRTILWVRLLLCVLAPAVILFCCQLITLQNYAAVVSWMESSVEAVWITYGALLGVLVLLFSVTDSLFLSTAAVAVPVLVFAFANHMKQTLNGTPIMISDLALAGSPGELISFLRPGLDIGGGTRAAICITLALLALIAVLGCRARKRIARWRIQLGGSVLGLVTIALCLTISPAKAVLTGHRDEIQAERNDRLGLLAGFYSGWRDSSVREPNAYNENNMNTILRAAKRAAAAHSVQTGVVPNVIMLMSESFCDPEAVLPNVSFQDDPIPNYRALSEKFLSGGFLSNTYAGGTGNVEMEVMTGLPIAFLGSAEDLTALRDRTAYNRVPSIVKAFGWQGYATQFIHSHNNNLYNRTENLPTIGFEEVLFDEDFPENAAKAGGYLSDMALTKKIIEQYRTRDKSKPLFLFGLSMENHQPYFGEKFEKPSGLRYSSDTLDETGLETLDNLLQGVHDADAALGALVRYFEKQEEPTIIVFWGDHLPGLNTGLGGDTLYSRLGYIDSDETKDWDSATMKKMHTTRYLVWNNYGAELDVPEEMSTLAMGTRLLDWAGVQKPLYYHWVDEALKEMLLYRQRLFVPAVGEPLHSLPRDNGTARDYGNLVYDIIYGLGYVSGEMTKNPHQ